MGAGGLLPHGVLALLSGLSVALTGFGCDTARELLQLLLVFSATYDAPSSINMNLALGLVTAVQVISPVDTLPCRKRRLISLSPPLCGLCT